MCTSYIEGPPPTAPLPAASTSAPAGAGSATAPRSDDGAADAKLLPAAMDTVVRPLTATLLPPLLQPSMRL